MMAAGNPNWHNMQQQSNIPLLGHSHGHSNSSLFSLFHHQLNLQGGSPNNSSSSSSSSSSTSSASSTSSLPFNPLLDDQSVPQDFPQSWSQLLLSGLASGSDEERLGLSNHLQGMNPSSSLDQPKVTPNNENLLLGHDDDDDDDDDDGDDHYNQHHLIKQEGYGHGHVHGHDMNYHYEAIHHQMHNMRPSTWSHIVLPPVSSPKSCVTTLSSNHNNNNQTNLMDFSSNSCKDRQLVQHSSELCNSHAVNGGAPKKPRVQSSSIPPLKVRKEKLGDKITALHQLVSPFGKTDTASVLLETIGCIRFLQGQIQALSSPYLGNPPSKNHQFNYAVKDETLKELRSRGLCLIPISCTQLVGSDSNTASEYWAPSIAGGF